MKEEESKELVKTTFVNEKTINSPMKPKETTFRPLNDIRNSFCIGDFTDNSLLYTGEEILHVSAGKEVTDGSLCEGQHLGIIELFEKLSFRMDAIAHWKSIEKCAMDEVYALLEIGDFQKAQQILKMYKGREDSSQRCTHIHEFVSRIWSEEELKIRERLLNIKEISQKAETLLNNILDILLRRTDENNKLREMIKTQHEEHTAQMADIVAESSDLKSKLIKVLSEYSSETSIKSKLEDDLLVSLSEVLSKLSQEKKTLKERLSDLETTLEDFKRREGDLEVSTLRGKLYAAQSMCNALEVQNSKYNETLDRLTEKNTKLMNDIAVKNVEIKKLTDEVGKKNEVVARQRALIQLFQEKLGGYGGLTVEELMRRKEKIRQRIVNEKDFVRRDALKREVADCDRRLSDLLKLQEKRSTQ